MSMAKAFILVMKERMGEDLLRLELSPKDGVPLKFMPAQFVNLGLVSRGKVVKRPYSIASSPDSRNLEFCIKIVGGEFTSLLPPLKIGAEFSVDGPFGPAFYDEKKDFVLIAGGVGIVPMMSILRHRARRAGGQVILFYSARSSSQMPYLQELQALSRVPGIRVFLSLTREVCEGWPFHCGRFERGDLLGNIPSPGRFAYFVCGKKEMVDEMREILLSIGANPEISHFEGWGV
jgi:ferredoxin-NADP reductase